MEAELTLRDRLSPFLLLTGIFALAVFVRTYFAYGLTIDGYLVSGGSDSYYFEWIIANILATGKHMAWDPMLNFPLGMVNPRPPFYAWSVVLTGILAGQALGGVEAGVGTSLLFSTAVWGALTVFPTYFLAKEVFGRRTGYVAAFFLAVLAAHIQRSTFSNADHDALALFFVVTGFYFFLRSLATLRERTWVESWLRPRAVARGLRVLLGENRRAFLLAILAGTAVATVALTWKGYAYAVVILIAYFLAQLLVHQIQNKDPLGVLALYTVTLGTAFLLAFPYYLTTNQVGTWFDVPFFLFLAGAGLGLLFAVLHRLPWLLVVPPVVLGFGLGTLVAAAYSPTVAQAIGTGLGYFVRTKVFETIAEAQPPTFSQGMLAFGPVTAFFAFAGIALMGYEYVKRPRPSFLFALLWMGAAIFMAMSAARFLFNASPAFAITAAWVTVLLVERLGLDAVRRAVASTGGSKWVALKRGLKVRHVAGALFVVFLLVLPNAWYAVDAGSPFELKEELDQQVLRATPEFLRPADAEGQALFYFGAFGFSVPLESRYYPAAWDWFRTQDADMEPPWTRPAFLSWWDYGFESIEEGRHPAVADNFQNGIPAAGHFLTAQSENEAIAILSIRLMQGHRGPAVQRALADHGIDAELVQDVFRAPGRFIPLIRADPDRFGRWDERIVPQNAQVIFLKTLLSEELDVAGQASLYRALRQATGHAIGYVAVDSRLIPFSGANTGIFFAPVKLSDHPVQELPGGRTVPTQFYELQAVTTRGTFPLGQEPPGVQVTNLRIEYQDMFYRSMIYRTFFGPRGEALGVAEDGLPALSGDEMRNVQPRQGWGLRHFRLVYKTAYFNPFPPEDVANHTDAWRAVNYFDALELQREIDRGDRVGTVDLSPASGLRRGVVILEYFDGALLRGRAVSDDGRPLPDVRITVLDEADVPHDSVTTGAQGHYQLVLPFGEVRVVASIGSLDNATRTGQTVLSERTFTVTRAQAQRTAQDEDGDGRPDYLLQHDFVVPGASIQGTVFHDRDDDGDQSSREAGLEGVRVQVAERRGGFSTVLTTDGDGSFSLEGVLPGEYRLTFTRQGFPFDTLDLSLGVGEVREAQVAVPGAQLTGRVTDEFGDAVANATVLATDAETGAQQTARTNATGAYRVPSLLPGNYTLRAEADGSGSLALPFPIARSVPHGQDLTVYPLAEVAGRTLVGFSPTAHVTVVLQRRSDDVTLAVKSDANGNFAREIPLGTFDAYALHVKDGVPYALLESVTVTRASPLLEFNLRRAHRVNGTVVTPAGVPTSLIPVTFEGDGIHRVVAGAGSFSAYLPSGTYAVHSVTEEGYFVDSLTLDRSRDVRVSLIAGVSVGARLFRDLDGSGAFDPGEGLPGILVRFRTQGEGFSLVSGEAGRLDFVLREGNEYSLSIDAAGYAPLERGPLTAGEVAALDPLPLVATPSQLTGSLDLPSGLDPEGVTVDFEALGDGAVSSQASVGPDGTFVQDLLPGRYRARVDEPRDPDGAVVVQSTDDPEFRVVAGRTPAPLSLKVVERVRVTGFIALDGGAFQGNLTFAGTEEVTVAVDGNYTAFVQRGNYTVRARSVDGERGLLESAAVTGPLDPLNFTLEDAAVAEGLLRVDGEPANRAMTLHFVREDGARLSVDTEATGAYRAPLVPGFYQVTASWRGVDELEGAARFVRYDLQTTLNLTESVQQDFALTRTLDNATVTIRARLSGEPVSAALTLRPANETALPASVEVPSTGEATIAVAPGVYDLYAFRDVGNAVALLRVEVGPDGGAVAVDLMDGLRVSGVARLQGGSPGVTALRFTATATAAFATDAQGVFEVFLPPGSYRLVAETDRVERTVPVVYRFEGSRTLTESVVLDLPLDRVDVRDVEVVWDREQRALVRPGETVRYTVIVRNAGNVDDTFLLSGQPAGWDFRFNPRRVSLPFGTENAATVMVDITSPPDALVAHDPLRVVARSEVVSGVAGQTEVEVDVLQVYGVSLVRASDPPTFGPDGMELTLTLANEGNGVDRFDLVLLNPGDVEAQGWTPRLQDEGGDSTVRLENVTVGARESIPVTMRLVPREDRVSPVTLSLRVASQGEPDRVSLLDVPVPFPRLTFREDAVALEGKGLSLGPPAFPWPLYGLLAASAVAVTVLLLRYGRRRRGR